MTDVAMEKVAFDSRGNRLIGHLYHDGIARPGIVVTGSWTTVKEQMADLYARTLADKGFTTLTFDFAGFGESEGEPRQYENPELKIGDIDAAVRFLAGRKEVEDGVGGLAICASAGYMAHAIARGAPIDAFVTVAAWLHDAGTVGQVYGGDQGVQKKIREGEAARRAYDETGEVRTVPAFSNDDPEAAMGAMVQSYYGDPATGAVPEWCNEFAVMSWPEWLRFDGIVVANRIKVPTLMIHSKDAVFPDNAKRFNDALAGPHEIVWREGTQLDFYHAPAQVDPAVDQAANYFREYLKVRAEA